MPRLCLSKLAASALSLALVVISLGASPAAADPSPGAAMVNIADTEATAETRSLFSYLADVRGDGVLFGHQHTIDNGITFTGPADGVQSDVLAGVGDYPAMFGWDTLILEGKETPGLPGNTAAQNVAAFRAGLQQAHRLGGISTISAHMRNFVTGKDFTDSSGRVVSHILPGGDKHADFNAYLDLIADLANTSIDDSGKKIPIIFRPFHENTGSWFWWGAAHATPGEYKEIFRYTVEYLRDTKDVSNLLYSYSPNGNFGGDPTNYLKTYPGDAWVDVLGYDFYENSNEPDNSDAWIANAVKDLGMLADLADERGKISAFTEFGRNGERTIKESGNKSLEYYTDLLDAIKADPKAKRTAYMQTWSNWGLNQFYVPYPAYADKPAHETMSNFQAFYDDPYSVFADDLPADVFTRDVAAAPAEPVIHLVTPADGQRITTPTATLRVKVLAADTEKVTFSVEGETGEQELTLADDGYWTGTWNIGAENLTNRTVTVTVRATGPNSAPLTAEAALILGEKPALPLGVIDDFEGYGDDNALQGEYTKYGVNALNLSTDVKGSGKQALKFGYDFTNQDYTGFGKSITADWSTFDAMSMWLKPDGSNHKLVIQVIAAGIYFEAYPSLAGTTAGQVSVPFADFRPAAWDTANADRRLTATELAQVTGFNVYLNKAAEGTTTSGYLILDDIRATAAQPEAAQSRTTLSLNRTRLWPWQRATAQVTVTSRGEETPTGWVKITVANRAYQAKLNAKGKAKLTLPRLRRGTYWVQARYRGDDNTKASTSRAQLIRVR